MEPDTLELAELLADVAASDTEYRDLYVRRARQLLEPLITPQALEAIRAEQTRPAALREETSRALEFGDWARVRDLARELSSLEHRLDAMTAVVATAEKVYGAGTSIEPHALGAYAVSPTSSAELERARQDTATRLEHLARRDEPWRAFYAARRAAVAAVPIATRPHAAGAAVDLLREEARGALHTGRWADLARLAETARSEQGHTDRDDCACGALALPSRALGGDVAGTERAARHGLSVVRLAARDDLRRFMSCQCALTPRIIDQPLSDQAEEKPVESCGCRDLCPDLDEHLLDALDLLKHHAFLTSLGTRYLPVFDDEVVLLETFPDTNDEGGALLARLGLTRRLGLSRLEIDRGLAAHGAAAVEEMALDPLEYVLVPVPFDVYMRAAPTLGFGRRPFWTHLDGYQVLRGWRLRGLVGGNARFGGPADLCSLGRDDPRDGLLLRLAVLRRRRFAAPVGRPAPSSTTAEHR